MFGANFMEIYQVIVSPDSLHTDIQSSIVKHTSNIGTCRHTERHFVKTNLLNSGDPRPNISTEISNSIILRSLYFLYRYYTILFEKVKLMSCCKLHPTAVLAAAALAQLQNAATSTNRQNQLVFLTILISTASGSFDSMMKQGG